MHNQGFKMPSAKIDAPYDRRWLSSPGPSSGKSRPDVIAWPFNPSRETTKRKFGQLPFTEMRKSR